MPIIRCRMTDCVNWDEGYCSAARINIDDEGVCLTYAIYEEAIDALEQSEEEWVEEESEETDVSISVIDEDNADDAVIRGRRRWNDW